MSESGRSSREQGEHDKLRYAGTDVLINKLGIRDPAILEAAERRLAQARLRGGLPPQARPLTTAGLRAIHRTLLQDIYAWAGDFRTYTTGRGLAPFAIPEFIEPSLDSLFEQLGREDSLRGLTADEFARKAAAYVNDINAIHPFVDGNGRAQRVWLRNMASAEGFYRSNAAMAHLISARMLLL
ncbi:MAG: Fic family protein [Asticcacaulis sp.]